MEVNMNVAEDQLVIIKTLLEESIQNQNLSNVEEALSILSKCIEDDFDTFMGDDDYLNVNDSQDFS